MSFLSKAAAALAAGAAFVVLPVVAGFAPDASSKALIGSQRITADIGGNPVVVEAQLQEARDCVDPESLRWGVEGTCPKKVIASLRVTWSGVALFVPLSAYGDLCEVSLIRISPEKTGFNIIIRGGDAATGYVAAVGFSQVRSYPTPVMTIRTVKSSEFPDEYWQRTEYKFNIEPEPEPPAEK